ncbi:hypothetical protein SAMN04488245_10117 [Alloyangia pacifica]|uniref:Uncharacterized protein n=1 Tax=Alloyangia pacifica TaxID=311180 RepID=A0A1I6QE38_9RHOB|nr:hypothetical protein SAMN04488245_10117 [Alloyangia pacifica]SFS50759.1 hypothetical protein SAMN04488050_10218 [Alloyangia pacifica]
MLKATPGAHLHQEMGAPGAAAINIGSLTHTAAVNPLSRDMPVCAFGAFTQDLHALSDWGADCGAISVAMTSTGPCGTRAFECPEARA